MFFRAIALVCVFPVTLAAQHSTEKHTSMHGRAAASLTAPGESISGALSEVIATLDEDASTDWSRVDFDALVHHLRQMHALFAHAEVASVPVEGGVRHVVSGTSEALEAARVMVMAHAMMVDPELGWKVQVAPAGEQVTVTVTVGGSGAVERLRALGFFGFMAAGAHHQKHHLMLARGMSPHGGSHSHRESDPSMDGSG